MKTGFTIVELLVVIVVIAILASLSLLSYNNVQNRARQSKISSDINQLVRAIQSARIASDKTLIELTGSAFTGASCRVKPVGTDLATLPRTDACWVDYLAALESISTDSGANLRNLMDPWGRPYLIDQNEGEGGPTYCNKDLVAVFKVPFPGNVHSFDNNTLVPNSMAGCT